MMDPALQRFLTLVVSLLRHAQAFRGPAVHSFAKLEWRSNLLFVDQQNPNRRSDGREFQHLRPK